MKSNNFKKIEKFGILSDNCSTIIKKENFEKINGWIGRNNNFILKYSAKIDGCNTDIFHEKWDNINGIVIVCKVDGGDIIGGYISTIIQKKDEFSDDSKAFIFNLTKNIIRRNKKTYKKAIKNFNNSNYFIRFGSDCEIFTISGNCLDDKKSYSKYCSCSGANFDSDKADIFNNLEGSTFFRVENFEVFQVI